MLDPIKEILESSAQEVDQWLKNYTKDLTPPLYLSTDLRHSGFKIAGVDTNLFPAGFNNLCTIFAESTILEFKNFFSTYYPTVKKIVIFAEEHTRNKFYLENVKSLEKLLSKAGLIVKIGLLGENFDQKISINLNEDEQIDLYQLTRNEKNQIVVDENFIPDLIISNNDFSTGIPKILVDISQKIIPHPNLGWHHRKKSNHFKILNKVIDDFCQQFKLDAWLLSTIHDDVEDIDLTIDESREKLATKADQLLDKIRLKYQEYQIEQDPYLFIKNDTGTYGMGIMTIQSGDELRTLNRKNRNKLLSSKSNSHRNHFFLQEGIPTTDTYSEQPIEPVIYAVGGVDIGGFFRINGSRNNLENLNAKGMSFSCLCLHQLDQPHEKYFIQCKEKESVIFLSRFLTKLAGIAASLENHY